jgi:Hydrazine synthase alpha subunit middle domain/WD40-like Beta Propeller Repeat
MIRQTRQNKDGSLTSVAKFAALLSLTVLIGACDGANQGVQIGNGQSPDPVVIDFPIAFVKSPIPVDDNGVFTQTDLREQITFDFGADLYIKDRASPSSLAVNVTEAVTQGLGAIRDVEMAYDGSTVLFAMRVPFDPNLQDEDQVTWNLWEYSLDTDTLRRIIVSDLTAEIGHDIMPKYLPDGRIIFSSTRQVRSQAVLLDEGKAGFSALDEDDNEFAFNLHIINPDGSGREQVTFNQSHDLDPAVMADGTVVFSRWDHNGPQNDQVNLYRMNPDGANLELLYGNESHDTGANGETIQFMQPRQSEDGRVFSVVRPFTDTEGGGEIIAIDTPQYVENTQPLAVNIGVLNGPAQEDATINNVVTVPNTPSPGGRYFSAYPIQDGTGRMLVSWSQCRLVEANVDADLSTPLIIEPVIVPCTPDRLALVFIIDPNNIVPIPDGMFTVAQPLYGIWIYDPRDQTQQPVVPGEEGFMFTEVVAADPRPVPPVVFDGANNSTLDNTMVANGEAILNIRSVYDFDGIAVVDIPTMADPAQTLAAARPARFLRIVKAVSQPEDDLRDIDDTAFGVTTVFGMREIVANVMVEPDGSVMTKVPANTALMVSVLDENGKRITPRHNSWISLRPGQQLNCIGCHVNNSGLSHGRRDAFDSSYAGASTAGVSWPNADGAWFIGDIGETMAETRANITCAGGGCSSIEPSMDIVYRDIWTDPNVRTPDADIDYLYSAMTTETPVSTACLLTWSSTCRAEIHYETHLHPLWSEPRPVTVDDDNDPTTPEIPVLDPNGVPLDNVCTGCHTRIDPADPAVIILPAGQLELTDGLSADEPDHFHAYRELLVTDNLQEVVNNALVDATQVIGIDPVSGLPILDVIPIPPPATIAGATASGDFFGRFEDPNDLHFDTLSPSERRLIAEWLDIGAQYYNDPFDAPEN